MELRILCAEDLSVPEKLSLLEIAQGISPARPDWKQLKRELSRYRICGFYDGERLFGYALVNDRSPYLGGSVQIVELRYLWQYNQEAAVAQMIRAVSQAFQDAARFLVMDVDRRGNVNLQLYRKLGFAPSTMRSPLSRNHVVLLAGMQSLLER